MHELAYRNNLLSLFRKYSQLVTWFSNTPQGRELLRLPFNEEIGLFLPNGYHKIIDKKHLGIEATFFPRPVYSRILTPALIKLDLMQYYLQDFQEAQKVFLWGLGLNKEEIAPRLVQRILHDSLTFNPDADPETTSVDGAVYRQGVSETFATIRSSGGTDANPSIDGSSGIAIRMFASATEGGSGKLQWLGRSITLFDTSSIPDSAVLASAIASIYPINKNISVNNFNVDLVACTPASNTDLTPTDYNIANWDMTLQSDTEIAANSLTIPGYNDFALNSTGLAKVTKTGVTKFGWVTGNDRANSAPTFTGNSQDDRISFEYAENSGGHKPKLVVTYTGVSLSPSASTSPSPSLSPSSSISASASPSLSPSASRSPSASVSPSASRSPSASSSPSLSPSSSSSASASASVSPSSSASRSISASPSQGYSAYSREESSSLPSNTDDLATIYTEDEEERVATRNGIRVGQVGTLDYMIHQFKVFVGSQTYATIEWEGQSTLAPSHSPVYLQIYNFNTNSWETLTSCDDCDSEVDFDFSVTISDLTNYKDFSNVLACRVYQLAI